MKKPVSWSELTAAEKKTIEKGGFCGAKFLLIPQFIFKASCSQHDFYYSRGGNFSDLCRANLWFYSAMLDDCARYNFIKMFFFFLVATVYFLAVSIFGVFFFRFGKYKTKRQILLSFSKK